MSWLDCVVRACPVESRRGSTPARRIASVLSLAVVLVGEDPASQVYVRNKEKHASEAGILSIAHRLPVETTQDELMRLVEQLNANPAVNGILVQLPLPEQIDEAAVLDAINPLKDVDVKRAKAALKNDPFFRAHKEWRQAVEQQIKMGVRAEQQAFAKHHLNFVMDTYLPDKLKNPKKTMLP